jgi:hypothetical protein
MADKVEQYQDPKPQSPGMTETQSGRYYEEFGIESNWPEDDFAYWVSLKRAEHEGRQLAERIKYGLIEMEKAERSADCPC